MPAFALFTAALLQVGSAAAEAPDPSAYLDPQAAAMVAGARTASMTENELISGYTVLGRQRIILGLRVLRRDRPIYRSETAARITWRRDGPDEAEVLGAREAIPVALPGVRVPDDLEDDILDLAFDPTEPILLEMGGDDEGEHEVSNEDPESVEPDRGAGIEGDEDDDFEAPIHPLAPGSEAHYRFRAGEETTIRLADGETIRLRELQVLPRRTSPRLLRGSFWLDVATMAPVRGVFTLAAPLRFSATPAGGWIPLPLPEAAFSVRHLLMEYALWEGRWMPSLITFEGTGEIGGIEGTLTFERAYEGYQLHVDGESIPPLAPDTALLEALTDDCDGGEGECSGDVVYVPRDTASLIQSAHLPPSIYSDEGRLTDARTLRELEGLINASSIRSLAWRRPDVEWIPLAGSLLRYNRVEGLTLGTLATVRLDPLTVSGAAWIGLAERSPSAVFTLARSRYSGGETLEAYRRLEAFTPEDRPFSLGNSTAAFGFGRDDGDYYRATGIGILSEFRLGPRGDLSIRNFLEEQSSVEKETDASVRNWLGDHSFRMNPVADEGRQYGSDLSLRLSSGVDPDRVRATTTLRAHGETGTHRFARLRGDLSTVIPLGPVAAGLEGGIGTSFGSVPVQKLWYLGGAATVRGFSPEERVAGDAFWTARAELGTERPAARLVLFADAGWAGSRTAFSGRPGLVSVGAGVSTLDGLIRLDIARALRGGQGWAAYVRLDGML